MGRKPFTMPICRRSFCNGSGKAPETVEEYIARQSPEAQAQLSGFVIRKNALYLPYDRPLPREALKSLVQEVFAEECI